MFSSVFPSSFSLFFNAFKERKKERKKERNGSRSSSVEEEYKEYVVLSCETRGVLQQSRVVWKERDGRCFFLRLSNALLFKSSPLVF